MAQGRGETRQRVVIITIDDVLRLFKDYLGEEHIPFDAMPHELLRQPSSRLMALRVSGNWQGNLGERMVDFQVKRFTPVGGEVL